MSDQRDLPFGGARSVLLAATMALVLASAMVVSCGGRQTAPSGAARAGESTSASSADAAPASVASADAPLPVRPGRLWRRDVVAVLSRGLGDFLSRLQVEPALAAGKFQGWRIVKLQSSDPMWQGTDLLPGDVITAINDRPIERPEQAFAAFQSLAVAKELRVTYQRAGARRDIVYPIDDVNGAR